MATKEEVIRFIISKDIMEYGSRVDASIDHEEIHHGTELLRLWLTNVIMACSEIALSGLENYDKEISKESSSNRSNSIHWR